MARWRSATSRYVPLRKPSPDRPYFDCQKTAKKGLLPGGFMIALVAGQTHLTLINYGEENVKSGHRGFARGGNRRTAFATFGAEHQSAGQHQRSSHEKADGASVPWQIGGSG